MPHVELPQAEFKVVVLGDSNTGKTSLVLRFAEGYFRQSGRSATVGAFFLTKRITIDQSLTCKLLLWDTAGQSQFQRLAVTYYRNAAAVVLTYDITRPDSLQRLRSYLADVQAHLGGRTMVMAIAACKCDLPAASPELEQEARALAKSIQALYVRTSAKNDEGVQDLFTRISTRVLQYHKEGTIVSSSSSRAARAALPTTPTLTPKTPSPSPQRLLGTSPMASFGKHSVSAAAHDSPQMVADAATTRAMGTPSPPPPPPPPIPSRQHSKTKFVRNHSGPAAVYMAPSPDMRSLSLLPSEDEPANRIVPARKNSNTRHSNVASMKASRGNNNKRLQKVKGASDAATDSSGGSTAPEDDDDDDTMLLEVAAVQTPHGSNNSVTAATPLPSQLQQQQQQQQHRGVCESSMFLCFQW